MFKECRRPCLSRHSEDTRDILLGCSTNQGPGHPSDTLSTTPQRRLLGYSLGHRREASSLQQPCGCKQICRKEQSITWCDSGPLRDVDLLRNKSPPHHVMLSRGNFCTRTFDRALLIRSGEQPLLQSAFFPTLCIKHLLIFGGI